MSVCRLCLNTNDVLPIFNNDGNENHLSQKILECVDIQISKDNVLPTVICTDCLGSVNTWYLFKQKCHQTQNVLTSMFKKELGENVAKVEKTPKLEGFNLKLFKASEIVCLSDSDSDSNNEDSPLSPPVEMDEDSNTNNEALPSKETHEIETEERDQKTEFSDSTSGPNIDEIVSDILLLNRQNKEENLDQNLEGTKDREEITSTIETPPLNTYDKTDSDVTSTVEKDTSQKDDILILNTLTLPEDYAEDKNEEPKTDVVTTSVENVENEESDIEEIVDKEPDSTVVLLDSDKELPVAIKQERLDPGYGDLLNVNIKTEPVSEDEKEEGDQMIDFMNDPNLDIPTNRCLICKYKYSSLPNLLRHTKSKIHQSIIEGKVKKEDILDRSLLKQALVKKKQKRRRAPFFKRKKHLCHTCHIIFPSSASLERHTLSLKHQNALSAPKYVEQKYEEPETEEMPRDVEDMPEDMLEDIPEDEDDDEFDDKDYICPMPNCNYSCKEGSTLLAHMTSHGINKIKNQTVKPPPEVTITPKVEERQEYKCDYHNVTFYDRRGYGNHLRTCQFGAPMPPKIKPTPTPRSYSCKICNLKFANKEVHMNHLRIYHRVSSENQPKPTLLARPSQLKRKLNAYCCNTCGKKFNFLYSLNYHLKTHQQNHQPSPITCKICKKNFTTYKVYRVHIKSHFLPPGSRKLFCSKCFKSFDSRSEIGLHRSRGMCKSIKMKIFTCNICNHSFREMEALNQHKETHCEENMCKYCNKTFLNAIILKNHLASHQEELEEDGSFPCTYCGKSFKLQRILTLHINNFCTNSPNRAKCNDCGTFVTKRGCEGCASTSEKIEIKTEPEVLLDQPDKLYPCPIGKMLFTNEKSMLRHYSYCNGECANVINCNICGKGFKDKPSMDEHTCVKNRKPYRYNCIKCMRSFSRKGYLVNHESKCIGYNLDDVPLALGSLPDIKPDIKPALDIKQVPHKMQKNAKGFYQCHLCPKTFASLKSVSGHQWVHKPKGKSKLRLFNCKFCLKDNIVLNQLYPHNYKCVKHFLMTQEIITCSDCDIIFSRVDTSKDLSNKVQQHMLSCYKIPYHKSQEYSESSPKLLCLYCSYAFSSFESLTAHKGEHLRLKRIRNESLSRPTKRIKPNTGQALGVHFLDNFIEEEMADEEMPEETQNDYEYETESYETSANDSVVFECKTCEEQFPNLEIYRSHPCV